MADGEATPAPVEGAPAVVADVHPAPWYGAPDKIEDADLRDWIGKKDFKDPLSTLKSYRELEKTVGANKLALPKEGDDITQWDGWDKLGAPKDAAGYADKIKKPELPEGMTWDADFEKQALEAAAKARAPAHVVQPLIDAFAQRQIADFNTLKAHQASEQQAVENLKKEWGPDRDQNLALVQRAARYVGLEAQETEALANGLLGGPMVLKALLKIGANIKEGVAVDGETPGGVLGAEAALAELDRLNERIARKETLTKDELARRTSLYTQAAPLLAKRAK